MEDFERTSSLLENVPEYKIILLGEVGVGKTTYLLRIHQNEFVDTSLVDSSLSLEYTAYSTTVGGSEPVRGQGEGAGLRKSGQDRTRAMRVPGARVSLTISTYNVHRHIEAIKMNSKGI